LAYVIPWLRKLALILLFHLVVFFGRGG